jgi:predicted nuclease with TOPRIM domain
MREPQDVSEYLAHTSKRECAATIRDWLDEITEEVEFLTKRKEEVEKEMGEFLKRVRSLNHSFTLGATDRA